MLPAFAQVSSAPPSSEKTTPRQHRPIRDRVDHGDGTTTSSNWSGYAVTGSDFTSAEGSWIVSAVTCTSGSQYSAFWVGIDGDQPDSDTVEQTGTESDCNGKNPSYSAWYEFYPANSHTITSVPVKPGDYMSAKVVSSGSEFTVTLTNVTTGKSYSKTETVSKAKRNSAEWIAEAPCCTLGGGILPLADFGTGLFGKDNTSVTGTNYAADSGTSGPISSFSTIQQINIESTKNVKEDTTTTLSGDGTSFSVTWLAK
jgi:hypothetical protein